MFKFQLAEGFCEVEKDGIYVVEPKYDGIRIGVVKNKDKLLYYSRNYKPLLLPSFMVAELKALPDGKYDGEIIWEGHNSSEVNGIVHRKNIEIPERIKGFKIVFFDMPSDKLLIERKEILIKTIRNFETLTTGEFRIVKGKEIAGKSEDEILKKFKDIVSDEGLIIKENVRYFEGERAYWYKVKRRITYEGRIVDVVEGTGRNEGRLGAFVVKFRGRTFRLGNGFTDEERELFWKIRDKLIGKVVEFETFGFEGDMIVRHPQFVGIRDDR